MEIGKQSIRLEKPVYVESWASVVGKKEGEGPLAPFFDEIETDDQLGQDNWEEAESMLQQKARGWQSKKQDAARKIYESSSRGICWHSPSLLPSGSANWSVQCTEYSGRVLRWVKH